MLLHHKFTIKLDARDSPNDAEVRRKLVNASSALTEKIATLKKILLDSNLGIRPQLRSILYPLCSTLYPTPLVVEYF